MMGFNGCRAHLERAYRFEQLSKSCSRQQTHPRARCHRNPPELPAERRARVPGGSAAPSSLGDMGGETIGVVSCGSVYMEVLVSGSHVIWRGREAGVWGAWGGVGCWSLWRGAGDGRTACSEGSMGWWSTQQGCHPGDL